MPIVASLLLAAAPAPADTVRVFAASSLTDAFREIAAAFEAERPGTRVELAFAGSQVLRLQIEQGAAADVFASADRAHAEALARAGLLETPRVFAGNALVVVVPSRGPRVLGLADLARPGTRVVVASPAVPAGHYAEEALRLLDGEGGLGPGFREGVRRNVVSEETNVRAVLSKVALGEADAGFVYATDAASPGAAVRTLELPPGAVAEYAVGLVRRKGAARVAPALVEMVLGERGQAILRRHGFR